MPYVPAKLVSIILLTLKMPAFVRRSVSIYGASLEEKMPFKVRRRKVKNREITYYSCSKTTALKKNQERCKAFIYIQIISEVGAQPNVRHSWFKSTVTQQKLSLPLPVRVTGGQTETKQRSARGSPCRISFQGVILQSQ